MFLIGLTGGIASGKSTVASILVSLGIDVIDADKIAREVVEPGKPAWVQIRREFGSEVLLSDGQLNRPALGRIVFSDHDKRRRLNRITHPEIHKEMFFQSLKLFLKGRQFVVVDVPLLYETKTMLRFVRKVIVVKCSPAQQVERLMLRNGFTEDEARKRIESQLPLEQKCGLADYVIDNTGDPDALRAQVEDVVRQLRGSWAHWKVRGAVLVVMVGLLAGVAWLIARVSSALYL
ncbi:dephospho-CoA kinase domain-containing protein [Rhipicephalus sanguineus]|uniref:dephospho-CoA kinase domain-containing protein n=1 Tax=Rhipicephalus sanguineus TaxID=34632 RepID=UPI001893AB16|nr:dephospho-CoA kinase domain-containing protein [Rhipicephalus sanguineus]